MLHPGTVSAMLLVFSLCLAPTAQCKTVVMIPSPFTSHTKYHTQVARALSKLGHRVWLTMPTYLSEKGYLDTSGLDIIPYETLPKAEERAIEILSGNVFKASSPNVMSFLKFTREICESFLSNHTFIKTIGNKKPDLIVIDNLPISYPLAIIAYKLKTPFAFVGSGYGPLACRVPFSPAETPMVVSPYSNKMSFIERLNNLILTFQLMFLDPVYQSNDVAVYAPEMPYLPLDILMNRAEIWLVEMDHILDYPRPTLPNVKLIGGTATGPAKPLPPHLASFMDGATQGVVIVSFGSYVLGVPEDISRKLFTVFQQLPMKVVFRSNLTSPDPAKIMTSVWIPQNDLLGHVNTKVFVSHCGKNGQYEALYHAVPIVATPLFGDQQYNAERSRVKGFGETVDLSTVTAEELKAKILKVATDKSYKHRIQRASEIFRIEYGVPMERAAFWLDHVMQYGGDYMRYAGQEVPYYQFLGVDLYVFVFLVVFVIVFVFWRVLMCVVGLCRGKSKTD